MDRSNVHFVCKLSEARPNFLEDRFDNNPRHHALCCHYSLRAVVWLFNAALSRATARVSSSSDT